MNRWYNKCSKVESITRHTFINDLNENSVIVDLGANKGDFSKKIAEKCGYLMLVLIEGNPELSSHLEIFFKGNNKVKILNAVIGGESKDCVKFYLSDLSSASSLFRPLSEFNKVKGEVDVRMLTLNDIFSFFNLKKIDLLKMDIEGAEWDVFENFSKEDFAKIDQISVEFHDFIDPSLRARTKNCIKKIKKLGYGFIDKRSNFINGTPYKDCLFYKKKYRGKIFVYRLKNMAQDCMGIFLKIPKKLLSILNFKKHKL